MNKLDACNVLGINVNATQQEIRRAYKKLVLKYHPDKCKLPNAQQEFNKIQIAYDTLSYDTLYGRADFNHNDMFENNDRINQIFVFYNKTVNDLCDKYEISNDTRSDILQLFDANDYAYEIRADDIHALYNKIYSNIYDKIINGIEFNVAFIYKFANYFFKK